MRYILFILFTILIPGNGYSEDFIALGHAQDLFHNKEGYKLFTKTINNEQVSSIFILGDSELGNSKVLDHFTPNVRKKIHAVPGNHEYSDGIESYYDNFNYTNKEVITESAVFLLLDSSQPLKDISILLKSWREKYLLSEKIVILMTHHRLWDDSVLSSKPYKHDKSYYFRDVYPLMAGLVDYVIAGNSKRQHFQDLEKSLKNNAPPNISTTYWEEAFPDFKVINVGMGNAQPYATYVKFTIIGKTLIPSSKLVQVSDQSLDSLGLLDMSKYRTVWRDQDLRTDEVLLKSIVGLYKRIDNFLVGFFFGIAMILFISKLKNQFLDES